MTSLFETRISVISFKWYTILNECETRIRASFGNCHNQNNTLQSIHTFPLFRCDLTVTPIHWPFLISCVVSGAPNSLMSSSSSPANPLFGVVFFVCVLIVVQITFL